MLFGWSNKFLESSVHTKVFKDLSGELEVAMSLTRTHSFQGGSYSTETKPKLLYAESKDVSGLVTVQCGLGVLLVNLCSLTAALVADMCFGLLTFLFIRKK